MIAAQMVEAAQAWLESLDELQRDEAAWKWPAEDERHRWNYTPVDHGGLPMGRMTPTQQRLALRLLASGLSVPGYVTAATVIGLENVLDLVEGWRVDWDRERGRDPELYYVRVFGRPSGPGPWSWRFGGHHVSVQHLVLDGDVRASTPCFLGANPAASPLLGGELLRPLGATEDLARELVRSLDEQQAARAVVATRAPADILTAARPRIVGASLPEGLPAAAMSADQRQLLRALLDVFVRRIPDELAEREAAKFAGGKLDAVQFAWAGGLEPGQPHYYCLQGPRLLAEYDNTQDGVNHIHAVWRDPEGDFGDDVLARHLAAFHGG